MAAALVVVALLLAGATTPELEEDAIRRPQAAPAVATPEATPAVQAAVEAIRAEAETSDNPRRDPVMEERCAQVTQVEMDQVEDRMSRLASETVMLGPDEMLALSCSRYQKSLRGEIESH